MKQSICVPLRQVIQELHKSPLSQGASVFGSMARGHATPYDLDLLLVLPGPISAHRNGRETLHLLTVARRWYGYFDPFIWDGKRLWVRNAEATAYERSRLSYQVIRNEAIPFSRLFMFYDLDDG